MLTNQTAYLACANAALDPDSAQDQQFHKFYLNHGITSGVAGQLGTRGLDYMSKVSTLLKAFLRFFPGDTLKIGNRRFRILTRDGHAPQQVTLYCAKKRLFFPSDQVIARISLNVSIFPSEPDGDPLGYFLRTIRAIREAIPEEVLALAGHRLPFRDLHVRCDYLIEHHNNRCSSIRDADSNRPLSVNKLVLILFTRELDIHQSGFAFSETLAHVNRMLRRSELTKQIGVDRIARYFSNVT